MEVGGTPLELWLTLFAIISVTLSIDLFSDHFHKLFKSKKSSAQQRSYPFGTDVLWGIIGAIAMRIVFILAGITLLETFSWMIYVLGGVLLFTRFRIISKKENKKLDIEKSLVL